MLSIDLKHLRTTAYRFLLEADRPLPTQRVARRLFGPRRHEQPETQVVVRSLLAEDPRFLQNHDGRWSARGAPHVNIPLQEATYAVVDLETTGSLIGVDEIIEIGLVLVQGGKVREQFSTLVRAGRRVPPWVENLTGIRTDDLATAPCFSDLAPTLAGLLSDAVFVAHDIRFDLPFLRWEFLRRGLTVPPVTGLCTLCLSEMLWPELESRSLGDLARHFRVPLQKPHRADQDASATAGILQEALTMADRIGMTNLGDLFRPANGRKVAARRAGSA